MSFTQHPEDTAVTAPLTPAAVAAVQDQQVELLRTLRDLIRQCRAMLRIAEDHRQAWEDEALQALRHLAKMFHCRLYNDAPFPVGLRYDAEVEGDALAQVALMRRQGIEPPLELRRRARAETDELFRPRADDTIIVGK